MPIDGDGLFFDFVVGSVNNLTATKDVETPS